MSCGLNSSVLQKSVAATILFSLHKVVNIAKCCQYTLIFYKCSIALIVLHSFNSYWLSYIFAILWFYLGCCCICRSLALHKKKNIVSYIFSKHGFILEHLQIYRIYWKVDICDPEAFLAMCFKFLDEYYLNLLILKSSVLVTVTKYYY